jgi:methylase of polypeptide subunit release factors
VAPDAGALRAALLELGFTADGVLAELGPDAFAALGRGEAAPVRHVLADRADDGLTDLIRLFLLGEVVPTNRLSAAVPLADAERLGLIAEVAEGDIEQIRARLHVQPYPTPSGDGFVVSDMPAWMGRTGGRGLRPDHVVGIGGATITLATITPRNPVDQALDLGTGCGLQALLAAGHSRRVVATDRSERALAMAQMTAVLSGASFDCRAGSLFDPVEDDAFDLIVANPPFVISPRARYTYREAPLRADDLSRAVVQQAAAHLRPGGVAVLLANWLHTADEPWHDRLASWAPPDTQMWAAQRERLTPSEYVDVWLRDSAEHGGPDHARRYAEWLTYFDDLAATAIGFGWIVLRRSDTPWFVAEDVADAERLPTGAEVLEQLADFGALHDATAVRLLDSAPTWRPDTELHRSWFPTGQAGVDVVATRAWRPTEAIDPIVVDLLAGTGSLADRIEHQADGDADRADEVAARALVGVRRLVGAGMVSLDESSG